MKDFFQTNKQLIEPLKNSWSLYAPVRDNDIFALKLSYWAEAPKNANDALVSHVTAFHSRNVTGFSKKAHCFRGGDELDASLGAFIL